MARHAAALHDGHQLQLLEGSVELFPSLITAMDRAHREIRLETYIFDFTGSGAEVAQALVRAAERGVATCVMVDGLGTGSVPVAWRRRFEAAGVQWRVYAPVSALSIALPGRWRRLHRKLCVVDGRIAFCGGINILDDFHDPNHGALKFPRFDFAVRAKGPLVADARSTMAQLWLRMQAVKELRQRKLGEAVDTLRASNKEAAEAGPSVDTGLANSHARAGLLLRDNLRYRTSIERAYRRAIGLARREILIANAYFVPGRRLRSALEQAARRGVRVVLLLQGKYEYFMQYYASRLVYGALLRAGVEIHEYAPSFLHAKVAVIDGHWVTVGSSNLDPLSMLLAREANLVADDPLFAAELRARLLRAIEQGGQQLDAADYEDRSWRERFKERLAWIVMRLGLFVHGKEYL